MSADARRNGWAWLCAFGGRPCSQSCCGFSAAAAEPAKRRAVYDLTADARGGALLAAPDTSPIKARGRAGAPLCRVSAEISAYNPAQEEAEAHEAQRQAPDAASFFGSPTGAFQLDDGDEEEEPHHAVEVPSPTRLLPGGTSSLPGFEEPELALNGDGAATARCDGAATARGGGSNARGGRGRARRTVQAFGKALAKRLGKKKLATA
jgi:hypothetical protein